MPLHRVLTVADEIMYLTGLLYLLEKGLDPPTRPVRIRAARALKFGEG